MTGPTTMDAAPFGLEPAIVADLQAAEATGHTTGCTCLTCDAWRAAALGAATLAGTP